MAPAAENLKKQTRQKLLKTFDDVKDSIFQQSNCESFEKATINDSTISLSASGMTKFFIDASNCTATQLDTIIRENEDELMTVVLLVGEKKTVSNVSNPSTDNRVQKLILPMSEDGFLATVENITNLQSMASKAWVKNLKINQAADEVKNLLSISRELNGERDIPKLLTLILSKARQVTNADAGSIYTVEDSTKTRDEQILHFRFTQNDSIDQNLSAFSIPVNTDSIVGNAVLNGTPINIPDLYELDKDPSKNPFNAKHDSSWDQRIGYESHSMLTLPMFDISHQVIGVIQLINRKAENTPKSEKLDPSYIIPFGPQDIEYAEVVAKQAGIALENANMNEEIQQLFDGFVNASVTAIEQRDPTTSGHSHRVATLTMELAKIVDNLAVGAFANTKFDENQMREIEYASLLHDFGKLGVRENVLVKSKKLYPWEMELLLERFNLIKSSFEIDYLNNQINFLKAPNMFPMGFTLEDFALEKKRKIEELEELVQFILKANEPTVLERGGFERLKDIANLSFQHQGEERPFLKSSELKALSVSRGSLTSEEFAEIQSHVIHTYEFLRKIPWGKKLRNIPQIAAKHHEKLDGTGYPSSAENDEIPIQTRMMTIADIFDALTAADRPYKKAVPYQKALDILEMEVKAGKVDKNLFQIFIESNCFKITLS